MILADTQLERLGSYLRTRGPAQELYSIAAPPLLQRTRCDLVAFFGDSSLGRKARGPRSMSE